MSWGEFSAKTRRLAILQILERQPRYAANDGVLAEDPFSRVLPTSCEAAFSGIASSTSLEGHPLGRRGKRDAVSRLTAADTQRDREMRLACARRPEQHEEAGRRSAGLHQGRNVGGQRAPDRKRRALHQAEIGARAGPIWHYVALRGTTWHKIDPYIVVVGGCALSSEGVCILGFRPDLHRVQGAVATWVKTGENPAAARRAGGKRGGMQGPCGCARGTPF